MFHELMRDDVYRVETPKLWLRWPCIADAPGIARYLADHEVTKMTSRIPHPYPPGEAERYVFETRRGNVEGNSIGLIIAQNAKPEAPIGAISLAPTESHDELVIGYWIGVPFWGKGHASEAVRTMIDIGFAMSQARRIVASVRTINPASRLVLERNGFLYTHDSEPFMPARNSAQKVQWFKLERDEWAAAGHAELYWSATHAVS